MAEVTPAVNQLLVSVKFGVYHDPDNKDAGKRTIRARVLYKSVEEAVECAAKYTVWLMQAIERGAPGTYPTDKEQLVDAAGKFTLTFEEDLARKSTEELAKMVAIAQSVIAARTAPVKIEELTEAELEAATAPVPEVKKAPKKAPGKK